MPCAPHSGSRASGSTRHWDSMCCRRARADGTGCDRAEVPDRAPPLVVLRQTPPGRCAPRGSARRGKPADTRHRLRDRGGARAFQGTCARRGRGPLAAGAGILPQARTRSARVRGRRTVAIRPGQLRRDPHAGRSGARHRRRRTSEGSWRAAPARGDGARQRAGVPGSLEPARRGPASPPPLHRPRTAARDERGGIRRGAAHLHQCRRLPPGSDRPRNLAARRTRSPGRDDRLPHPHTVGEPGADRCLPARGAGPHPRPESPDRAQRCCPRAARRFGGCRADVTETLLSMRGERSIYVALGLISFATLVLQVSLTRLFSFTLYYYFAYMVISTALLGLAAAGSVVAVAPGLREGDIPRRVAQLAVAAGLSIMESFNVIARKPLDPGRPPA